MLAGPFAAFTAAAAAALPPRPGVRAAGAERHHGRRDDVAHEEKLNERRRCRCRVGTVVDVDDEKKRSFAMSVWCVGMIDLSSICYSSADAIEVGV
jgi:hypothetical protein